MDEGLTNDSAGHLTLLGAGANDVLQVVSLDGTLSASTLVTEVISQGHLDLISPATVTQDAAGTPYLRMWPTTSDGALDGMLLVVTRTLPTDRLRYELTGPGSIAAAGTIPRDSEEGDHRVGVSFVPDALAGYATVLGERSGSYLELNVDYCLQAASGARETNLFSNDGNFKLHLDAGSLPPGGAHFLIASPWGLPGPLPEGLGIVGEAYDVTASSNLIRLAKPAVLRLHYDEQAGAEFNVESIAIYRWDLTASSWRRLGGDLDSEKREMTTIVSEPGLYALLGRQRVSVLDSLGRQRVDDLCRPGYRPRLYLPTVLRDR